MTNAEKFEEVFGIKIEENHPADPCDIFDHNCCINHCCNVRCPAYHFWNKEFKKKPEESEEK